MEHKIIMVQTLVFTLSLVLLDANQRCSQDNISILPKYHLMEKCHRSKIGVLAKANYVSLVSCQKFAVEKKGLALNFSPPEAVGWLKEGESPPEFTCEVLQCAESETGLTLVNDTLFDYYSLYANPLPDVNATCIPGIGMFSILKKQNYTNALLECKNHTGSLADVMSEQRTDVIAQMVSGAGVDVAYVGMRSDNGSSFVDVAGNALNCITYRAWEPGHPKRKKQKYGCVGITRTKMWRSLPCKTKLPALCQLNPEGPYKRGSIFAARRRNETSLIQNTTMSPST